MEWHVSSTLKAAARTAGRRDAPPDEREDALLQAAREVAPVAKALPVRDILRMAAYAQPLTKAYEPPREDLARMAKVVLPLEGSQGQTVWLTRPVGLDFPQLRRIVQEDPVLKAIIWTRIHQVQRFLRPSAQEWKPGYRIRFRDRRRRVSPEDQARLAWLESYVLSCGAEFDPRRRRALRRDNLWDWAAKHLQDSLSLDAAPVELIATPSGRTHGWVHVDGGSVYLVDPLQTESLTEVPELHRRYGLEVPDTSEVIAVLAREGRVVAWYTHEELLYRVRRPRTESWALGYGQPEPEDLIRIVTGFLNALILNLRGFSHNSIPKGILTIFGDFTEEDIEQFKAEWDAYVSGLSNRWRVPVLFATGGEGTQAGASFIPIGNEFNEMYFAKWMTFLVAIKAALYGMDPEEINFESFTARPSTLSGSDTEERLASSKDKGLWPLLQFLRTTLNEILYTVDPEVELDWTGLEVDQQASRQDEEKMLTLGEYRQRRGEPLLGDPVLDNAPMSPALQTIYMHALQAKQQAQAPLEGQEQEGDGQEGEAKESPGPGEYEDEEGGRWRAHEPEPEEPEDGLLEKAWRWVEDWGEVPDDGL